MREMIGHIVPMKALDLPWEKAGEWAFYKIIFDFIDDEIQTFQANILGQMLVWISGMAVVLVTLWILWQGYQILQGKARNAMEIMVEGARATFVTALALTMTLGNASVYQMLTDTVPREITYVMTGKKDSAGDLIDKSMNKMTLAMAAIETVNINAAGSEALKNDKDRAAWMAGVGTAGPMLVGGALQVMYKFGLALFVGFGPLFILSLLFRQTQSLFQKWLLYGIGTMFSFALMAFMSVLVSKIVTTVSATFVTQYVAAASLDLPARSVSSMAMQQGGIGLLLTLTLVTIPPMAAYFFQGTLGSYLAYSVFGGRGGAEPGQRPGEQGYRGQASQSSNVDNARSEINTSNPTRMTPSVSVPNDDTMKQKNIGDRN